MLHGSSMKHVTQLIGISVVCLLLNLSDAFSKVAYNDTILDLLHIIPSHESIDYVWHKKQFQLQGLLTEQRHPNTNNLSYRIVNDTRGGITELLAVDQDISKKFREMASNPRELKTLTLASRAIEMAIIQHRKIYFYGTGATGRLSVLVESSLWRPFWEKVKHLPAWKKINRQLPNVENMLIGTITGGDRALVSSMPGFEDLPIVGKLQLQEQSIQKDDLVFAITEGGETSAVIGTILAADKLNTPPKQNNHYFIYNNPDKALLHFSRSRSVLQNPNIIKINLTTGPQAIAGSTRMQATSSELYLVGILLEDALQHVLQKYLSKQEMQQLGFCESVTLQQRLLNFQVLQAISYHAASMIASWTNLETEAYATHHIAIYFANQALLPVFTDITERSPTFRLEPLDTVKTKKSWVTVWTSANSQKQAWYNLLHHPFRGLSYNFYLKDFMKIQDPFLRTAALQGLQQAGNEQQFLYDFSFSKQNITKMSLHPGDLGTLVLFSGEQLTDPSFYDYLQLLTATKTKLVILDILPKKPLGNKQRLELSSLVNELHALYIPITVINDPLGLNQQLVLKMLLNAHSSAVMAKLGRVVGNTMTSVNPSNLKLIGRATYLIQLQINAVLTSPIWLKQFGARSPIRYAEANAILYNAMEYMKSTHSSIQTPEVALSIIRVLESLKQQRAISWQQAEELLYKESLRDYLLPFF
jgi:N-acetylmuramic acid 6-phosphate (MurNAc-6-P) etherase